MTKNEVKLILEKYSITEKNLEKKATVLDSFTFGDVKGNRLQSGKLRSQFIIQLSMGASGEDLVEVYEDQYILRMVEDDFWKVERGCQDDHLDCICERIHGFEEALKIAIQDYKKKNNSTKQDSYQKIYYGAPGSGKSWKTNEIVKTYKDTIRTTFHPESDYSTFVGCYKPKMESLKKVNQYLTIDRLATILKAEYEAAGEGSDKGKALAVDLYAEKYYDYLDGQFGKVSLAELVNKAGLTKGYTVGLRDSINVAKYHALQRQGEKHLVYTFVAQAFTKAYVQAWEKYAKKGNSAAEPQFLVIEEINRGNCAQIFGDLFQLLDRKNGFSEYPIEADADLMDYLNDEFSKRINVTELPDVERFDEIKAGKILVLPPNFYIWATMNTSDQSLFPMDSAFKRRWEWQYVPIKKDDEKVYKIAITDANGERYDWWTFLQKINKRIFEATQSEDKKLGYFFAKPRDGDEISLDVFVNKVLFYLYNDVFKDDGLPDVVIGDLADGKAGFAAFFTDDGEIDEASVAKFLEAIVGVNEKPADEN